MLKNLLLSTLTAIGVLSLTTGVMAQSMGLTFDPTNPCAHEEEPNVSTQQEMCDGCSVYTEIMQNQTHRYFYSNYNVTAMNQEDRHRNLIINLEPCKGVVYLFVRKTRRCYPNPYSCIDLSRGKAGVGHPRECEWTHYMSVIDGTRDGAPTSFELPMTSTKYFISVFATEKSRYTLTFLSDVGAYPRPGARGVLSATQKAEGQVQLSWQPAQFAPAGVTEMKRYWVYSAMLLGSDQRTNAAVFLSKRKIMNTVCGLKNNTNSPVDVGNGQHSIPALSCASGMCNATIGGVITGKRYIFNVIAESERGYNSSYAGLILETDWQVMRRAASEKTISVVGAVTGSVLGMVILIYVWMINLYGK